MTAYIAILEDAGPDTAVGVWFPDLPGCYSAGDTVDEALRNAKDAIAAYAENSRERGPVASGSAKACGLAQRSGRRPRHQ